MDIAQLLMLAPRMGASDVHISAGSPPMLRLKGEMTPVPKASELNREAIRRMIYDVLTDQQKARFEENLELDMAVEFAGVGRFRANVYMGRNGMGAAFRLIPDKIQSLQELELPDILADFARFDDGLILVTGPTGTGKSTTLAAMVDIINSEKRRHIVTVEDPIEFIHESRSCLVNQREVGPHTHSFANALRSALREDPDVILIGEMRDLETISLAVTAAETGHLVLSTVHTPNAPKTIDRLIDVFPQHQQEQIRSQLAESVQAIFSQILLPRATGEGRIAAMEIMVATPAIRNLIRENKTYQMRSIIQTSGKQGMMTLDKHLMDLVLSGRVSRQTALKRIRDPEALTILSGGVARDLDLLDPFTEQERWNSRATDRTGGRED